MARSLRSTDGETSFAERAVLAVVRHRHLGGAAISALMRANELLGLALGVRLAEMRDSGDRLEAMFSEQQASALLARCHHEVSEILASRLDKIPDKHRPRYTKEERYRILRLKRLLAWNRDETARRFRVCSETVARWEREALGPGSAPKLVQTKPPVRRYADAVRQIVHSMRLLGFGGNQRIAQTLMRAGVAISKRTVGRILREKPPRKRPAEDLQGARGRGLLARYPNHVFLIDLTEVPGLFGLFRFNLALVLDVFSRFPVCAKVFATTPTGKDLAELVKQSVRRHGKPKNLVSDQGPQLISERFRAVGRLGLEHRFGAIGEKGSIAVLESLWRSLKELLLVKAFPPLAQRDLERRLELTLRYYAFFRPHQGLGGATPAEIYFGHAPAHLKAVPPPRARPREGPDELPLAIDFVDPERRLPILVQAA